jgi:hypothetical protein
MVFNATFNNILAILWQLVLLAEESEVPGENHRKRGELKCSGRIRSSCSTSSTCRINLVTNPVISHY